VTSRTYDANHEEITDDVLALFAETNRKDGRPHCILLARRCEDALAARRRYREDYAVMAQYCADHGLQWPPPPEWTPGFATSEN
jgi:hypothetical protein